MKFLFIETDLFFYYTFFIMLHFDSDYMEGVHSEILKRLIETNMEKTSGYGSL